MQVSLIEREPDDVQQPLSVSQITQVCERAFGSEIILNSIQEFSGGTFNNSYLIEIQGQGKVVLRVAPRPSRKLAEGEEWLMRREYTVQPFLAGLGALVPKVLFADFTHQIIERDYLFQSYIPGQPWPEIEDTLKPEENDRLWQAFGQIVRQLHATKNDFFGLAYPAPTFKQWSEAVLDWIERVSRDLAAVQAETSLLSHLREIVSKNKERLDVVKTPSLLHGDLWTFNVMVERGASRPQISGILDSERAWWGDPLADWTMFVLGRQNSTEGQQIAAQFWQAYGPLEYPENRQFREQVYNVLHAASGLAWAIRHNDSGTLELARRDLPEFISQLEALVG